MRNFQKKFSKNCKISSSIKHTHISKIDAHIISIEDIQLYDNIYVNVNDQIYKGWISAKTNEKISLSYEINNQLQQKEFLIADLKTHNIKKEINGYITLDKNK